MRTAGTPWCSPEDVTEWSELDSWGQQGHHGAVRDTSQVVQSGTPWCSQGHHGAVQKMSQNGVSWTAGDSRDTMVQSRRQHSVLECCWRGQQGQWSVLESGHHEVQSQSGVCWRAVAKDSRHRVECVGELLLRTAGTEWSVLGSCC